MEARAAELMRVMNRVSGTFMGGGSVSRVEAWVQGRVRLEAAIVASVRIWLCVLEFGREKQTPDLRGAGRASGKGLWMWKTRLRIL
jgi:hypothetical protein